MKIVRIFFISLKIIAIDNLYSISYGQKIINYLPTVLNETSGLCFYNDSILVSHNDGGNSPVLYFLNLSGVLIHTLEISNAKNEDWEDITSDGKGTLFIADIGNNNNDRKNLCIYKITEPDLLTRKKVKAEKISFSYPNQTEFPPKKNEMRFDAEALVFYKDSLYIFTKCRAKPYDGIAYSYSLGCNASKQIAKQGKNLNLKGNHWYQTSITAACVENDKLYILTYSNTLIYTIEKNKLNFLKKINHSKYTQKEAIAVSKTGVIYFSDEFQKKVGGGTLLKW